MPRAAAKRRRVTNKRSRGGRAGKVRRARGASVQSRRRGTSRRRARRPTSYKRNMRTGGRTSNPGFYQDIARVMFPHEAEIPCRFPDGQGIRTLAMNVVTTLTFTNMGSTAWDTSTQLGPSHSRAIMCTPGSIHCPLWMNMFPTLQLNALGRPNKWTTALLGNPTYSSMYSAAGNIGTNTDFSKYRVTGATLRMTYIGNADDSGGEICVQKYNPRQDAWNSIANGQTHDDEPAIPLSADLQSFDMRVERMPSRLGCYMGFSKSAAAQFSQFKDLEATTSNGNSFILAEGPAVASLEACIIYITGTKPSDSIYVSESKGQWRLELIQTVELVPKTASLLNKVATTAPGIVPLFHQAYENLHEMIAQKNLDIVPSSRAADLRTLAVSGAYTASSKASSTLGHGIPGTSVDPYARRL